MTHKKSDSGAEVYRLTDIVVEEVSLVDRAANQHQFLIVKRSDMGQSKENEDENAAAKTAKADAAAMRTAAVGALETLTQAVEQLGEAGDVDAETLAEIAGELQDVIQQLTDATGSDASKAGGKKPKNDKGGAGGDNTNQDPNAQGEGDCTRRRKADDLVKSVRELLGKVAEQLNSSTNPTGAGAGGAGAAEDAVSKALGSIADALKEHGQRLAKLEKQHGLPNSRPTSESRGNEPDEDDDASWPLDMNRPLDRESVDKAVSFHDRGGAR